MKRSHTYTTRQFVTAVMLCAGIGWVVVGTITFLIEFGLSLSWEFLRSYFIAGLPVALVFSWAVVAPVLWWAMRHPVSWVRAAVLGAGCLSIPLLLFVSAMGQHAQPYLIELGLVSALLGALIAIALRAIIGPGRARE